MLTERLKSENVTVHMEIDTFSTFFHGAGAGGGEERLSRSCYIDSAEINMGKVLGRGSFGMAHKAVWRDTDVAVKLMHGVIDQQVCLSVCLYVSLSLSLLFSL